MRVDKFKKNDLVIIKYPNSSFYDQRGVVLENEIDSGNYIPAIRVFVSTLEKECLFEHYYLEKDNIL